MTLRVNGTTSGINFIANYQDVVPSLPNGTTRGNEI
jgi:hypothetical protein